MISVQISLIATGKLSNQKQRFGIVYPLEERRRKMLVLKELEASINYPSVAAMCSRY